MITLTNDQARIVAHHLRERAQTRTAEEYANGTAELLGRVADDLDREAKADEHESEKREDITSAIAALLSNNGCDCECGHHPDEHFGCTRCLACRIEAVLSKGTSRGAQP